MRKVPDNKREQAADRTAVLPSAGVGGAAEWLATHVPRRNFLVRAGATVAALAVGGRLAFPGTAMAACMEGSRCVTTRCYRRYVCGCQSVFIRHCPGGTVRNGLAAPYSSTFDIQIEPQFSGGYYFGFSVNQNARGWVLNSCLTTYSCS